MHLNTLFLLIAVCAAPAAEEGARMINGIPVPPSPGDPVAHPGHRIWDPPRFTHYPLVAYEGESRNLAFVIPIPPDRSRDQAVGLDRPNGAYHNPFGWQGGDSGTISWNQDSERLPITLPDDPELEAVSGLLDLPLISGRHRALLTIETGEASLDLRVVAVRSPWPHQRLVDGFPVDSEGIPVVLVDRRRNPNTERQWAALRARLPRPDGRPLVVGDPLAAPGGTAWEGLDDLAELRVCEPGRYPHHSLAVAVATLPDPLPSTIVWSPGNDPVHARLSSPEEERILGALRNRLEHLGALPRLVLLLPPMPVEAHLQVEAQARRGQLRRSAQFLDWEVIDADALNGSSAEDNRVAEGVYARYPVGEARLAIRDAVRAALQP